MNKMVNKEEAEKLYEVTGIFRGLRRNTRRFYLANTFQEALKEARQEDGLKLSLDIMEELELRKKGVELPKKECGIGYGIKLIN